MTKLEERSRYNTSYPWPPQGTARSTSFSSKSGLDNGRLYNNYYTYI